MPLGDNENKQSMIEANLTREEEIESELTETLLDPSNWDEKLNRLTRLFFDDTLLEDKQRIIALIGDADLREMILGKFLEKKGRGEINWSSFPDLDENCNTTEIDSYLEYMINLIITYLALLDRQ